MLLFYSQPMSVFIIDCPSFSAIPLARPRLGGNAQLGKRSEEKNGKYDFFKQGVAFLCALASQMTVSFRLIFFR
jgi:hypothetical protein